MDRTVRMPGTEIPDRDDHEVVLSGEEARQGETSGHMRRVLIYSLMLMLVAGAIMIVISG